VYIEGRLKTSKWQDEHGNDRYNTAIIVTKMKMLGSSNAGKPPVSSGSGGDVPTDTPSSLAESGVFDDADWDDDIPF
jgi:single-strand DNA-binding protein